MKILAIMLIMGSVALGVAQDWNEQSEQPGVLKASIYIDQSLTTQTSLTATLTAGEYPINGFTLRVEDLQHRKQYITFTDSLQPGESLEFTVSNLVCDQGYRLKEKSSDGYASTGSSAVTLPCE